MGRKLLYKSMGVIKRLNDPYYQGAAAEVAFYLLFSVLPVVLILTIVLRFFDISPDIINTIVDRYTASEYTDVIVNYLSTGPSSEVTVVFFVIALWAASKSQFSLIRITNYSYGLDGKERIGYIKSRLRALITEVLFIALIIASLILLVFGEMLFSLAQSVLLEFFKIDFHISSAWMFFRWPIAFVTYVACIAINYSVMPNKRIPIHKTLPGAVFASVVMLIATWIYSIYLNSFSNFSLLYGSLASIIALLFWFFILSYIMIIGILINVSWFDNTI